MTLPSTVLQVEQLPNVEKNASSSSSTTEASPIPVDLSSCEQPAATNEATNQNNGLEKVFGLQFFARPCMSEVDRYLREDSIGLQEDPFQWWVDKMSKYPQISLLAHHYLTIPLTSFNMTRLQPLTEGFTITPNTDSLCLPGFHDEFEVHNSNLETEDVSDYAFLWHNWN